MDWRALHDVVAVAETGSLSAAARRLEVSQPTVGRRIEQLEEQLGALIFNRTAQGLSLTAVGERIIDHAKRMDEEALSIERVVSGANQQLEGSVRISLIEDLGIGWLPKKMKAFHDEYPHLSLEVNIDNRNVDLFRREADIAVRLLRPEQPSLICRKVGKLHFGLYANHTYLEKHGIPERFRDLKNHNYVGFDSEIRAASSVKKLEGQFLPERILYRSNSHIAMLAAVREGVGCGAFCCYLADKQEELKRILEHKLDYSREIWLVTHEEIHRSTRIRAVFDFLADAIQQDSNALQGK